MAAELTALVDRGLVRVLDLLILRRTPMDLWRPLSCTRPTRASGQLRALEELGCGITGRLEAIGLAIEPGSLAAVLVYENSWAGPFASAVRRSSGQLIANGRIPTQALLAAIESEQEGA